MSLGAVTVSMGVSVFPEDSQKGTEILRQADIALYNAKSLGRNRVVCWRDVSSEGKKAMPRYMPDIKSKAMNSPFEN
jgi:predicted signal transduction protein with EAL and GGDEF domain